MFRKNSDRAKFDGLIKHAKDKYHGQYLTTDELEWFLSLKSHERVRLLEKKEEVMTLIRST